MANDIITTNEFIENDKLFLCFYTNLIPYPGKDIIGLEITISQENKVLSKIELDECSNNLIIDFKGYNNVK